MDQTKNILFVVDSPAEGQELQQVAGQGGYVSRVLTDPAEALEFIWQESPDLVVFDAFLPGISGYEFCKKIKSRRHSALIPLIVLSAQRQLEESFLLLGIDAFVSKPVDEYLLLSKMTNCLLAPKIINPSAFLEAENAGSIGKHRFLVVTPMTDLAVSVVKLLLAQGQEVVSANNLEEATEHAGIFSPDIYLIDSDGTGKQEAAEIVRVLRRLCQRNERKFIVFSARDPVGWGCEDIEERFAEINRQIESCLIEGAVGYLGPFQEQRFVKLMGRLITESL